MLESDAGDPALPMAWANTGSPYAQGFSMAISMTQAAADHVRRFITNRGKGLGIRLGVRTSGCSGMAYRLEFADELAAEDLVFETHGVKVIVDPKSLLYLDGTELDYAKEGLSEGFKFNNPNVKGACGCGESFNV
jgi:iron-sulfur cluster assembly protein